MEVGLCGDGAEVWGLCGVGMGERDLNGVWVEEGDLWGSGDCGEGGLWRRDVWGGGSVGLRLRGRGGLGAEMERGGCKGGSVGVSRGPLWSSRGSSVGILWG